MTTGTKKFHLLVYDNFHNMDESEAYNHGRYDTYEDALIAAKAIVDEFLEHNWKSGITPCYLIGQYCLYGEDPIILPDEHGKLEGFSARTYAKIRAVDICRKLENKGSVLENCSNQLFFSAKCTKFPPRSQRLSISFGIFIK